jgi:hypothetical protein
MMQTVDTGGADVHAGALPHRLQALQHLNILGRIRRIHGFSLLILNKKVKVTYNSYLPWREAEIQSERPEFEYVYQVCKTCG